MIKQKIKILKKLINLKTLTFTLDNWDILQIPTFTRPVKSFLIEKTKCKVLLNLTINKLKTYCWNSITYPFFLLIEMRLDICLFHYNLVTSILEARKLISYGHIFVNQKRIKKPSYICLPSDYIIVNPKQSFILNKIKQNLFFKSHNLNISNAYICYKTCRIFIWRLKSLREQKYKINEQLLKKSWIK